jgi:hypothetical protein
MFLIMKKIFIFLTLSLVLFLANTIAAYADGGWANVAAILNVNNSGATNYLLYNAAWNVNVNLSSATPLDGHDFGNVTSLTLNGGIGAGWASHDKGDYYNGNSFVLYYRVYATSATPPSTWSNIPISTQTFYDKNNNWEFTTNNAAVDLLQQVSNAPGTYYVEITMSKDQFYNGGDWNSMVPGGQSVAYSPDSAGYKATFTIQGPATGVVTPGSTPVQWNVSNRMLTVKMSNRGFVEVFTMSGQLIDKQEVNGNYSHLLSPGIYIVKANGETFKVLIS